jgi:hypothetical protein
VRALANEEGVLDGSDEHSHVVRVGEIVCLYYHRILNMPYTYHWAKTSGVKATLELLYHEKSIHMNSI